MYGFIYKKFTNSRGLFYNGEKENLKHTVNPEEAQAWYNKVQSQFRTIKLKRLNTYIELSSPIGNGGAEDKGFVDFVNKTGLSLSMQQVLNDFLNRYYLSENGFFVERVRGESDDQDKIGVLLSMRNMIEGLIRRKPIKVDVGQDRNTKKTKYSDWYIHQNFGSTDRSSSDEVANNVNVDETFHLPGCDKDIPIMGAYAQKLLAARFPKPVFNGRRLQLRQQRFLLERGQQTIVLAPREGGKTLIAAFLAFVYLMKQETDYDDEIRGTNIHFFGLTESQLDQVAIYVVDMVSKMIDNKKAIKYNKTDMEVVFMDGGTPKRLKLMSAESMSKGRGERPTVVFIDEAGYTPEEVHKIALGTAGIPIVMITTVNYGTKRNWAYDLFLEGLNKMRSYAPIEETIKDIYFKYGLDQVRTTEQLEQMVEDRVFRQMRDDLYASRPLVSLRFTIEDRENITDAQKEITIDRALSKYGEKFLAAEYYSEYVEELTLFNPDGLFEVDMPKMYDIGFVGYDPAYKFDNAALVLGGYFNGNLYIENSIILPQDPVEKIKMMRMYMQRFKFKCKKMLLVVDVGQSEAELQLMEERGFQVDYAVSSTKGSGINYQGRMHLVGKKVLVIDIAKETFFDRSIIRFNADLTGEFSITDELQNFTLKANGKYEASQGKDDQVNAMMLICYACYNELVRNDLGGDRYLGVDSMEQEYEDGLISERRYNEQENRRKRTKGISMGLL